MGEGERGGDERCVALDLVMFVARLRYEAGLNAFLRLSALLVCGVNCAGCYLAIIYESGSLQDQADQIAYHTQKGIDYLDKYGVFLKERAAIEEEYASKLRSVVCT